MPSDGTATSIRLDKLLWYLRFTRSRSLAQAMVAAGHIRLDGRRVTRGSTAVHTEQTLVLPVGELIEVIRLTTIPKRRGPPAEARACYIALGAGTSSTGSEAIKPQGNAVTPKAVGGAIQ